MIWLMGDKDFVAEISKLVWKGQNIKHKQLLTVKLYSFWMSHQPKYLYYI